MTRKLALPDELLLQVQKPARYLGNEIHAVYKDRKVPIRFAMCFPDVYEIGMSHLGIQILYTLFNRRRDTWCERVFAPWTDMDALLRREQIPLFALESQDPVKDFDFLGITLQFELCYTNILQILDLSGIPLEAAERTGADPIVIGGGPCACNPEPVARFFDVFYIGEGETSYDTFLDLYRKMKEAGQSREAFLRAAARIPGIYVPSLYEVEYGEVPGGAVRADAGTGNAPVITSFSPKYPDVPARVRRQAAPDLDDAAQAPYPVEPLIPFITVTQDRVAVELQRGCIRGCRFCQAGMIYRPNRERSLSTVKAYADAMLDSTGQDDILLSSLSSSDYSCIHEIVEYVSKRRNQDRVKLQVPSLRIDSFSLELMAGVQDVRRSSLTFAPEAGSQRLRDVINKGITEEDILTGAREAFRGGWNKVKLYFMLGLPTETDEDRVAISDLANKISAAYYEEVPKEKRNGRCRITVSTSFFVPKAFTPFQWAPMYRPGDCLGFAATVNHAIYAARNHRSIQYSWHDAQMIYLEGVLARGDRRVADLILEAYRQGAMFDCWLETWQFARWEKAAEKTGISMDFYAVRAREKEEILPWDFIDAGVHREFLWREWEKARAAQLTPNCREACSGCGAASYGCGVCLRPAGNGPADKPPGTAPDDSSEKERVQNERICSAQEMVPTDPHTESDDLCTRVRMRLAKYGPMKFIGHLELMRFLQKCLRRTDIDVHYSDGITPRMIMSTAMPLGLGLTSSGEYIDLEIGAPVSTEHALRQLRPLMPEGLEILDFRQIGERVPTGGGTAKKPEKAMSVVTAAAYEVRFRPCYQPPADWKEILKEFVGQEEIPWTKETKKGFRTLDMKPLIYSFSCEEDSGETDFCGPEPGGMDFYKKPDHFEGAEGDPFRERGVVRMCVCSRVGENLRPEQLIGEAFARKGYALPEDALQIHRVDLYAARGQQKTMESETGEAQNVTGILTVEKEPVSGSLPAAEKPGSGAARRLEDLVSLGEMGRILY